MQTLFLLSALVAVLSVGIFVLFEIAVARTGKIQPVSESQTGGPRSKVSIVIPARNEKEDIEEALRSVLGQKGVELHVIVVNDHSTDGTDAILKRLAEEDSRITVVENTPLQAGWLGKPNAMNHGVALAQHELILFTDADVIHCPTSFATGVTILQKECLDFLSCTPRMVCESFWENVFIPLSLFPHTAHSARDVNNPKSPEAWAAGAFMLIKADVLQVIGGIESVKSAILDDSELARVVKRSGHHAGYHLAPDLMHVSDVQEQQSRILGTDEECDCPYVYSPVDVTTCNGTSGAILPGTYCRRVRRGLDERRTTIRGRSVSAPR